MVFFHSSGFLSNDYDDVNKLDDESEQNVKMSSRMKEWEKNARFNDVLLEIAQLLSITLLSKTINFILRM